MGLTLALQLMYLYSSFPLSEMAGNTVNKDVFLRRARVFLLLVLSVPEPRQARGCGSKFHIQLIMGEQIPPHSRVLASLHLVGTAL